MIPTAEEFFIKDYPEFDDLIENGKPSDNIYNKMIEFAKLHVTEALRRASEEVFPDSKWDAEHAYPLENIK